MEPGWNRNSRLRSGSCVDLSAPVDGARAPLGTEERKHQQQHPLSTAQRSAEALEAPGSDELER